MVVVVIFAVVVMVVGGHVVIVVRVWSVHRFTSVGCHANPSSTDSNRTLTGSVVTCGAGMMVMLTGMAVVR